MKLSQLTTDGAADALCVIAPHVYNITSDRAIVESVGKALNVEKTENLYGQYLLIADRIVEILPLLLKDHRADVYGILSVLNECTAEEIASQNILKTIRQVREAIHDEELRDFFKSSVHTEKNAS